MRYPFYGSETDCPRSSVHDVTGEWEDKFVWRPFAVQRNNCELQYPVEMISEWPGETLII
jgi:hypothetical protein